MMCPVCGTEKLHEEIGWNYCDYCGTVLFFNNPKDYIENKFGKYPKCITLNKKEYIITTQYYDITLGAYATSGVAELIEEINEKDYKNYYKVWISLIEGDINNYAIVLKPKY